MADKQKSESRKGYFNRLRILILFLVFVMAVLVFLPGAMPENQSFYDTLNSTFNQGQIVIIFNPGGFGNAPLQNSELGPIINGIKNDLTSWGYDAIVIPYWRTQNNFFDKLRGLKEFGRSFQKRSEETANSIEQFIKKNANTKVIMTGLSNGSLFVDEVMAKVPEDQNSVYAIELGKPFEEETYQSANILRIDNQQKDPLSNGDVIMLAKSFIKGATRWLMAKMTGDTKITLAQSIRVPHHDYPWESPMVGQTITDWLEQKIGINNN